MTDRDEIERRQAMCGIRRLWMGLSGYESDEIEESCKDILSGRVEATYETEIDELEAAMKLKEMA